MTDPKPSDDRPRGGFVNLIGWLSFLGLFAVGIAGLAVGAGVREPSFAGATYLLIGGSAFGLVLALVLRR